VRAASRSAGQKPAGQKPAGQKPAGQKPAGKAATKAEQPALSAGRSLVYSVRRRVIVSLRRGWKRKTTRNTTTEWRHGNCPVRHRSRQAAARCRNP
jgi:hypothetical protein